MKCVHCCNDIPKGEKEKDHLFPKSWYPDTTSTKVQRWTFPSCSTCNRDYGAIEEELLISIGMAIDPFHYASRGISQKAINALYPNRAKNKKERLAREAVREKIAGRLVKNTSSMSEGIIPNLARGEDKKIQYNHGLFIPAENITMLCKKFVKGVTWVADRLLIDEKGYTIKSFPVTPDPRMFSAFSHGQDFSRPPGLIIKRLISNDGSINAVYLIMIWQQYLFTAHCIDKKHSDNS